MESDVCHELLMPQGSHFSCFVKISNQKKATPTFALIRDLKRKRRAVRNSLRSNSGPLHRRFHSKSRGRIHGEPFEPIFDRCAMGITGIWMCASLLRALRTTSAKPSCDHVGRSNLERRNCWWILLEFRSVPSCRNGSRQSIRPNWVSLET